MLRREIWVDRDGGVARYNLAYINAAIYAGDNGRVLGYDSAHERHHRHHRHHKGKVTSVKFESFQKIEARFEREWTRLAKEVRNAQD